MSTPSHRYLIDPRKAPTFKRQTNISLLVPYLFPVGLVVYQLVRTGYNYQFIILGIAISILSATLLFFSIKKSNRRIDSMKLEVSDDTVTLTELNKPNQIKIANITSVASHVNGMELKVKPALKNPFVIHKEFEKFDQIKKLIEAKVAKNKR